MAGWSCTVALGLVSLLGLLALGLAIQVPASSTLSNFEQGANFEVQSRSYFVNPLHCEACEVTNKVHKMELPTGHIALKGLTADGQLCAPHRLLFAPLGVRRVRDQAR